MRKSLSTNRSAPEPSTSKRKRHSGTPNMRLEWRRKVLSLVADIINGNSHIHVKNNMTIVRKHIKESDNLAERTWEKIGAKDVDFVEACMDAEEAWRHWKRQEVTSEMLDDTFDPQQTIGEFALQLFNLFNDQNKKR